MAFGEMLSCVLPTSAVVVGLGLLVAIFNLYEKKSKQVCKDIFAESSVLFVTAHPDDECMFFGPSVTAASEWSGATNVHLLCFSTGTNHTDFHLLVFQKKIKIKKKALLCRVMFAPSLFVPLPVLAVAQPALLFIALGDFYHRGAIRRQELLNSCRHLGISEKNVCVINDRYGIYHFVYSEEFKFFEKDYFANFGWEYW